MRVLYSYFDIKYIRHTSPSEKSSFGPNFLNIISSKVYSTNYSSSNWIFLKFNIAFVLLIHFYFYFQVSLSNMLSRPVSNQ